jgi:hypothetical protein
MPMNRGPRIKPVSKEELHGRDGTTEGTGDVPSKSFAVRKLQVVRTSHIVAIPREMRDMLDLSPGVQLALTADIFEGTITIRRAE